jgi:hypothetical protein
MASAMCFAFLNRTVVMESGCLLYFLFRWLRGSAQGKTNENPITRITIPHTVITYPLFLRFQLSTMILSSCSSTGALGRDPTKANLGPRKTR